MYNPVTFVSLGPGDPDLITLKGLKTLQNADVVFCPSTPLPNENTSSRAKDILLQLGIDNAKISLFNVPMSKDRSLAKESYKNVAVSIAAEHQDGKKIAVTAEGDAGFYSTIYYISEYLKFAEIPISRVAGVPAFIASGTLANIHIVKQEEELNVIPGIVTIEELDSRLKKGNTIVVMKASQCEDIIKEGLNTFKEATFHYFENVGITNKEYYTSDKTEIENRKFPYFSLIIIQAIQ